MWRVRVATASDSRIVGDDDDCHPLAFNSSRRSRTCAAVEVSRLPVGSSHKQQRGPSGQGAGDRDTLPLSPTVWWKGMHAVSEPDLLQRVTCPLCPLTARNSLVDEGELHVVQRGAVGHEVGTPGRRTRCATGRAERSGSLRRLVSMPSRR